MFSNITNYANNVLDSIEDGLSDGIDYVFEDLGPYDNRAQNASLYAGGALGFGVGYLDGILDDDGEMLLEETLSEIDDPVVNSYMEIALDMFTETLGQENTSALGQGIDTVGELTTEGLGYLDEASALLDERYGSETVQ